MPRTKSTTNSKTAKTKASASTKKATSQALKKTGPQKASAAKSTSTVSRKTTTKKVVSKKSATTKAVKKETPAKETKTRAKKRISAKEIAKKIGKTNHGTKIRKNCGGTRRILDGWPGARTRSRSEDDEREVLRVAGNLLRSAIPLRSGILKCQRGPSGAIRCRPVRNSHRS